MKSLILLFSSVFTTWFANVVLGEVTVRCQQSQDSSFFQFDSIPLPAIDDAASGAKWQVVEGIPDYIHWFLYEPQSKGATLNRNALAKAKHDASYRVSANFIDWVVRNHDSGGTLLQDLNADARQGRYSSELWKRLTGITELELADAWRQQ